MDMDLDITEETCPMTFVRTRLALDRLASGGVLRVRLKGEEPWRNVTRNAVTLGHAVLADETLPDGVRLISIRKG
ncbi:sulfurtransferase TusA family protein [Lichenicoccus sp.]|uniref:sulfurtransferase TusA family protein n=1 Tax=Lichenicoccus sp. TaxID=2781899 RepID=UPI003D14EEBB